MSRARLAGAQPPPLLLPAVIQGVTPQLSHRDLLRLLACCHELRALEWIDLDLSDEALPAPRALTLATAYGQRFCLSFTVDRCSQEALTSLLQLPGLRSLSVRPPSVTSPDLSVRSLAATATATGLRQLRLLHSIAKDISDVSPLSGLHSLTHLAMHHASGLVDLAPLAECRSLQTLDLRRCARVVDLRGLAREGGAVSRQLSTLTLQGCCELRDASPLCALRRLRVLDLSRAASLEDVSSLGRCAELHTLVLTGWCALPPNRTQNRSPRTCSSPFRW